MLAGVRGGSVLSSLSTGSEVGVAPFTLTPAPRLGNLSLRSAHPSGDVSLWRRQDMGRGMFAAQVVREVIPGTPVPGFSCKWHMP